MSKQCPLLSRSAAAPSASSVFPRAVAALAGFVFWKKPARILLCALTFNVMICAPTAFADQSNWTPEQRNECIDDPDCCLDGEPGCCGGQPLEVGQGCCNGVVYTRATHGCCDDEIYTRATQCCKNGEIVTEAGPHYDEWACSKQGRFSAVVYNHHTVQCVGTELSHWNINVQVEDGEIARNIEYDCPGNQSPPPPTKETAPVSYTRSDITWDPPFPYTFNDRGVYEFTATASATSSNPLCDDIPETTVGRLIVTVSAPVLSASATPNPVCPSETVTFSASANCAGGDYTWSGAEGSLSEESEANGSFDTPGWHSATVSYKLHEAEVSRSVSVYVKAPTVTASASPSPAYVGQTVTFSSSSDCNAQFSEWKGAFEGNFPQESISFDSPNTYTATAYYTLNDRLYWGSASVEVLPVQVTAIAAPSPVCAGETVTFSATGYPSDGTFYWTGYVNGPGASKYAVATNNGWANVVYTSPQGFSSAPVTVPVVVRYPVLSAWANKAEITLGEEVTFSASVDCPSPTGQWAWSGAVTGFLTSASTVPDEGGFHTATVTYTDPTVGIEISESVKVYVRSSIPDPDPDPDPEEGPCSDDPAANHGEVWPEAYWSWYGRGYWWGGYSYWHRYLWNGAVLPTDDPNMLLLVKNLPPKAPEGESSAQFYIRLGWKIVTNNTPRERDLTGQLRLLLAPGQTYTDAYDVEVASRDIDGDWLLDANDKHIFEPYQIGANFPVLAKGHGGCGIHGHHGGFELFRFTMHRPEPLTLVAEVDPDVEHGDENHPPEGDGSPLKRTTLTFVSSGLTPDYNRDGKIDANDRERFATVASEEDRSRFHFWVNDNQEKSESNGNDIPGAGTPDYSTTTVNTVRDLIDFFPVSLDIANLLETFDDPAEVEVLLWGPNINRIVYPDTFAGICPEESREYLTNPAVTSVLGTAGTQSLHEWTELSGEDIARVKDGKSVFLFEGRRAGFTFLRLRVRYEGVAVGTFNLPILLSPVEEMFRHKNLLAGGGGDANLGRPTELFPMDDGPPGFPDYEVGEKNLVFVHGYNVNPQQARGWNSAMFRRFYWSGLNARFYGVTWHGSQTQKAIPITEIRVTPNFHVNVVNALHTAEDLANFLGEDLSGPTAVVAHSLGNMVVSSAITDYSVNPDSYFMINAAVATEAYDGQADPVPGMIHRIWSRNNFPERLWASEWHKAFDSVDNRSTLSWRGRFENFPPNTTVWNFYSSKDEVFDPYNGNLNGTLGYISSKLFRMLFLNFPDGRHTWPLQELFKGRNRFKDEVLGSTYGGWGLSRNWEIWVERRRPGGPARMTRLGRQLAGWDTGDPPLSDIALQTKPFFKDNKPPPLYCPTEGSAFVSLTDDAGQRWGYRLKAQMIPAQTYAAGRYVVPDYGDLNIDMDAVHKVSGAWPADRPSNDRGWRHSDIREVAYPYTYNMFDNLLQLGDLK